MKRLVFCIFILAAISLTASAQTEAKHTDKKTKIETPHSETKIKKTSTPKQKVHNVLHPRRKHYNGVKVKHEAKKTK